jgi:hypothetical protein
LGLAAGFAVASKHTCLLTIAAVMIGLLWVGRRWFLRTLGLNALSAVLAFGVFFALNPAWWGDPLHMPGIVLSLRQEMMGTQETFYGFSNIDRALALVQYPFGSPQFFEDAKYDWTQWIGGQIAAYNSSGLAGVEWSRWIGIVWAALLTGCVLLVRRPTPLSILFLCVLGLSAAELLVINRLPWQRYYLPLAAPLAITAGLGFYGWWRMLQFGFKRLQAPGHS